VSNVAKRAALRRRGARLVEGPADLRGIDDASVDAVTARSVLIDRGRRLAVS
jgi:hypothetical protein